MATKLSLDLVYLEVNGTLDFVYTEDNVRREVSTAAEISVAEPVTAYLHLFLSDKTVMVTGTVKGTINLECSRCLEIFSHNFQGEIETEMQMNVLENGLWDIVEELRRAIIIALPIKPLCKIDCLGLCPTCGTNCNTTHCTCKNSAIDNRWSKLGEICIRK